MRRHSEQTAEMVQPVPRSLIICNLLIINPSPHLNSHFLQVVPCQAFSLVEVCVEQKYWWCPWILPLAFGSGREDWRNRMLQQLVVLHWKVSLFSLASHTSVLLCFCQLAFPAWPVQRRVYSRPHLRQLPSFAVGKDEIMFKARDLFS